MDEPQTTEDPSKDRAAAKDVETDPALDDSSHGDWTSEGGAMPSGPATDRDAARPTTSGSDDD